MRCFGLSMRTWIVIGCWIAVGQLAEAEPSAPIGWRGDGSGRYATASPPTTWSKDSPVVWKTELPGRGYSSPVLHQGRLYLTAEPAHVLCCDAATGSIVWQRLADYAAVFGPEKTAEIEAMHKQLEEAKRAAQKAWEEIRAKEPESAQAEQIKQQFTAAEERKQAYEHRYPPARRGGAGNAASTAVCDGQRIYVVFGTGIVAAYDLDGQPLWLKQIEGPHDGFGHSASPALADGKLIVHIHNLVALDVENGQEVWRQELGARFGTPLVVSIGRQEVIITPGGALVRARDGHVLARNQFELSNNSPIVHDGILYAHGSGKIKALRLPTELSETLTLETLWESSAPRDQRMASAVYHQGLLYGATRSGILDVIDAQSGDSVYRKRLDIGEVFASVTLAGDLLFVCGNDGRTLVLRPGREFEELSTNPADRFLSSPLFVDNRLIVRTERYLICLGN